MTKQEYTSNQIAMTEGKIAALIDERERIIAKVRDTLDTASNEVGEPLNARNAIAHLTRLIEVDEQINIMKWTVAVLTNIE